MAWVRRVRTASGSTAVQIAESVAGRRRIVRHVGSARDEAELGLLMEEAPVPARGRPAGRARSRDHSAGQAGRDGPGPGTAGVVRRRAGTWVPAGGAAGADAEDGVG